MRKIILLIVTITLLIMIISPSYANLFEAAKIRKANHFIKIGKLPEAEKIYQNFLNTKRLAFNKGYLYAKKNDAEKSEQYYKMVIENKKASKKQKAFVYLNLGNNSFRAGDFKEAITTYRYGLLLDPHNFRLKYNLELANNAKKVAKNKGHDKQNKKDQNQKKDDERENKNENNPQEKNAKNILDAFKAKELNDLKQGLQNQERKSNVEKDW